MHRAAPLVLILCLLTKIAFGAEVVIQSSSDEGVAIAIVGEIEAGDFDQFRKLLAETEVYTGVAIHSPGGDLIEAVRIGRLIRENLLPVTAADSFQIAMYGIIALEHEMFAWWPSVVDGNVFNTCYSACFVIWASGVDRQGGMPVPGAGTIMGLHRPHFDDKYFSALDVDQAQQEYEKLLSLLTDYLVGMGITNTLIEKMLTIPSNELYLLTPDELSSISGMIPAIDEWTASKCSEHEVQPQERADWHLLNDKLLSNLSGPESHYLDILGAKLHSYNDCRRSVFVQAQLERRAK